MKGAEDGAMEKTQRLEMFTVQNADFTLGQDHRCNCVLKHPLPQNKQTNKQKPSHVDTVMSQCSALDQGLSRKSRRRDGSRGWFGTGRMKKVSAGGLFGFSANASFFLGLLTRHLASRTRGHAYLWSRSFLAMSQGTQQVHNECLSSDCISSSVKGYRFLLPIATNISYPLLHGIRYNQ